jgi:hypothetical protein
MKNTRLILLLLVLTFSGTTFALDKASEKTSARKVYITYDWSRIRTHGSNQVAIWIEDTKGNHIQTLFATKFTSKGGYKYRPVSLSEWTAKFDLKNAKPEEIDAVTGATPQTGPQALIWDGKDRSGKRMPNGKYIVRMEANILDADKMFFEGVIELGGADQKTAGKITYSRPELASGQVLFKNVQVEYK